MGNGGDIDNNNFDAATTTSWQQFYQQKSVYQVSETRCAAIHLLHALMQE